jgi:hypothetical protein
MINAKNERVWVKFHLKTQQGNENLYFLFAVISIGIANGFECQRF